MYDTRQDVVVLTIDIIGSNPPGKPAETPANLADFMKTNNYTFPVLLDMKQDVTKAYGIRSTPTNFLIDGDGVIRQRISGAFPSQAAFDEALKQILSK